MLLCKQISQLNTNCPKGKKPKIMYDNIFFATVKSSETLAFSMLLVDALKTMKKFNKIFINEPMENTFGELTSTARLAINNLRVLVNEPPFTGKENKFYDVSRILKWIDEVDEYLQIFIQKD